MIHYNSDTAIQLSFINKHTKQKVGVRGLYVSLQTIPTHLINRFAHLLPKNTNSLEELFLEASALAVIMASNFKFDGTFKLQLNCYDAPLKAILVDVKSTGETRGLLSLNNKESFLDNATFIDIVGEGYMIFNIQNDLKPEPYQAIVDLDKDNLSKNAQYWYNQSEQILTDVKLFNNIHSKRSGGLLLQIVPNNNATDTQKNQDLDDFNTLSILAGTVLSDEFFNTSAEELLYRMFNEYEIIMHEPKFYEYSCSCNKEKVSNILQQINEKHDTKVECNFCGKVYN